MLDPRIYRAALIPALLAFIVVAFSLQDRPRPVGTTLAPIAFDGDRAWQDLQGRGGLAARYPDRRPGERGRRGAGRARVRRAAPARLRRPHDEQARGHAGRQARPADGRRGADRDARRAHPRRRAPRRARPGFEGVAVGDGGAARAGPRVRSAAPHPADAHARLHVRLGGDHRHPRTRGDARRGAGRGRDRPRRPRLAADATAVRGRLVRRPRHGASAAAAHRGGVAARGDRRRSRGRARRSSSGRASPRPGR